MILVGVALPVAFLAQSGRGWAMLPITVGSDHGTSPCDRYLDRLASNPPLAGCKVYVDDCPPFRTKSGIMEYSMFLRVGACMSNSELLEYRTQRDHFFKHAHESPVPHDDRDSFDGLTYFEPDDRLVFEVALDPVEPTEVAIATTKGEERAYLRIATATVEIEGENTTIALYSTGHDTLFLPFRDATSGSESYGAARYVDIHPEGDGAVTIDFNYAYAPFCAFSDDYSCALPPAENWLTVPIRAGERLSASGS